MFARKPNAPKDRIILRHTPSHWMAEFVGSVAAQVRSIHGSSQVPTGFDGCVTVEVVRRTMAELNPNSEIVVADDEQSLDFTVAAAPQSAPEVVAEAAAHRHEQSLDFTVAAVSTPKPQVDEQRAASSIARDAAAEIVAQRCREAAGVSSTKQPPSTAHSSELTLVPTTAPKVQVDAKEAPPRGASDVAAEIVAQQRREAAPVSSAVLPPAKATSPDITPAPATPLKAQAETPRAAASNPAPTAPVSVASGPAASASPARAAPSAPDEKQRGTHEALKRAVTLRKELGLLVACSYLKEHGWTFEAAHEVLNRICPAKREACRVLVVDDNLDTVHTTALLLRDRGHEVEFAINGIAALFIAQRFRPHVVFLDLGLPDSDGVDLARQLKHHPELKNVRIIAMTGRAGDANRTRAMSAGCDEYLMKPVASALLDAMMEGPKLQA